MAIPAPKPAHACFLLDPEPWVLGLCSSLSTHSTHVIRSTPWTIHQLMIPSRCLRPRLQPPTSH